LTAYNIYSIRHIRERETGDRHIPIIALTAFAFKGYREHILSMGMDEYITKPVETDELNKTIEKVYSNMGRNSSRYNGIVFDENGDVRFIEAKRTTVPKEQAFILDKISLCMIDLMDKVEEMDIKTLEKVSYELKSLFMQIGADELKISAFKIELATRRGNLTAAIEASLKIKKEFEAFKKSMSLE